MATNKSGTKKEQPEEIVEVQNIPDGVLTSKQEVADLLRMSVRQFSRLLQRYPFCRSGAAGKLNGRWHVAVDDVWRWYRYVQRQEIRHPDSRRMRPEEPPEIADIHGR